MIFTSGYIDPVDLVTQNKPDSLCWRSVTAGNRAALVFETTASHLVCTTPVHSFECGPNGYVTVLPNLVDGGIAIGPAPAEDGPREVSCCFHFDGKGPYWLEVTQVNGACAFWGVIDVRP